VTVVACAQLALTVGDRTGNLALAEAAIRDAAAQGARLVVLPELMASGYVFADAREARALAEPAADGPTATLLRALAAKLDLVLVAGVCELDRSPDPAGVLRNSAILVDPSGVRAVYRKAHLWDAEKLVFTPGDDAPAVVDTAVGRLGVLICYDLEFPEWPRLAALSGADALCVPTNWPRSRWPDGERPGEVVRAQAAASSNRVWVIACDRVGAERGVDWTGGSVVLDPDGFAVTELFTGPSGGTSRPGLALARVNLSRARDKAVSARNHVLADRRPQLYGGLTATGTDESAGSAEPR
jgi:5-aminopentanamidase